MCFATKLEVIKVNKDSAKVKTKKGAIEVINPLDKLKVGDFVFVQMGLIIGKE